MSQKIVIPKGMIDSSHTTVIEIPNYLHETSTVVVTMPKITDSSTEQAWEENEYAENVEHNESDWNQYYNEEEANDNSEYGSDEQDQDEDQEVTTNQVPDQEGSYVDYAEEVPELPARRSKLDPLSEEMRKRVLEKKRELMLIRAERQRMLEGEGVVYEAVPVETKNIGQYLTHLSEVPKDMRARSSSREKHLEMEKKRRQQEPRRYQPYPQQQASSPPAGFYQRDKNSTKYPPIMRNQQYVASAQQPNQQWNPDVHVYPNAQYPLQSQHRIQAPMGPQRRLSPSQAGYVGENLRQYQKMRGKTPFNISRN